MRTKKKKGGKKKEKKEEKRYWVGTGSSRLDPFLLLLHFAVLTPLRLKSGGSGIEKREDERGKKKKKKGGQKVRIQGVLFLLVVKCFFFRSFLILFAPLSERKREKERKKKGRKKIKGKREPNYSNGKVLMSSYSTLFILDSSLALQIRKERKRGKGGRRKKREVTMLKQGESFQRDQQILNWRTKSICPVRK